MIPLLLSAFWGPGLLFFIFIFFGIGIYFATSVVMAVLVGLSGDNALHFIFSSLNDKSIHRCVDRIRFLSVISILLVFIKKIGLMMMLGFMLGWIGEVLVLKSLLSKVDLRK